MQRWQIGLIKAAVWAACLAPLVWLVLRVMRIAGPFVADPVYEIEHVLGNTGLRLLLLTLAVTPLRLLTGWNVLQRFRRLLGLFSFTYFCLHFAAFVWLDLRFEWGRIFSEIAQRPYLTLGMLALLMLIPLAVTSSRRWTTLHRLVYPVAILGVVHFWWQVKADAREPALYAAILALLLGYRVWRAWRRRAVRKSVSTP